MSTKTNCEKCIFADFSDSTDPCAMGIIEKIQNIKEITVSDNFNTILHYRCPFAFSVEVYKNNQNDIGSIEDLKQKLISNAIIGYYMVVFLEDDNVLELCETIKQMRIKPKFLSLVIKNNNDTENIISTIKTSLSADVKWKLHNFLEDMNFQDALDTIFSTNTNKNDITYFWINSSNNKTTFDKDILKINDIITIEQPFLHALFRNNTDGLFLTFNNYENLMTQHKTGIIEALQNTENPLIRYYG